MSDPNIANDPVLKAGAKVMEETDRKYPSLFRLVSSVCVAFGAGRGGQQYAGDLDLEDLGQSCGLPTECTKLEHGPHSEASPRKGAAHSCRKLCGTAF